MNDSRHTKYLGLPSIIGRSKKQIFAEIREKVGKKLAGWKGKLLSMGGKEILIKQLRKPSPPTLWVVSFSQWAFVKTLKGIWEAFGGVRSSRSLRLLGLVGRKYANLNLSVVWVSAICMRSIWPCLQNRLGGFLRTLAPWQPVFWRLNISHMKTYWMLVWAAALHSHGEVFSKVLKSLRAKLVGELETGV